MTNRDRLIENPEQVLNDIAERRGLTRDQLAEQFRAIREASEGELHLSLSQAQRFFERGAPAIDSVRAHVDKCGYCQALVDAVQPESVERAVAATERRLRDVRTSTFAWVRFLTPVRLGMAFAGVAAISLFSGVLLAPTIDELSPHLTIAHQLPSPQTNEFEPVRAAFSEGRPEVAYRRLTLALHESGLREKRLAAVKHLESAVQQPISEEYIAEILSSVLDAGRPINLSSVDAEKAENAMTGFAQLGDHPRALTALGAYLQESKAPSTVRIAYSANVESLKTAALLGESGGSSSTAQDQKNKNKSMWRWTTGSR